MASGFVSLSVCDEMVRVLLLTLKTLLQQGQLRMYCASPLYNIFATVEKYIVQE